MQTIYLDISNKGVVPTVYAKQNDVGRKFAVILTDSGLPYIPVSGSVFSIWYKGASGEGNYTDIGNKSAFSLNGNKVEVEMIVQMLSAHGDGILCLTLNSPNGNQISSWNIPYLCEKVPGFESEGAKEYYTAFSESVEKLKKVTDNLTPEAIGAAPAGYGLGGFAKDITGQDLNNIIEGGWYWYESAVNSVDGATHCYMEVIPSNGHSATQIIRFMLRDYSCAVQRVKTDWANTTWGEWEWENPPMVPGVEYRTTERFYYNGASYPVYTMELYCGGLPASGYEVYPFPDAVKNAIAITEWSGFITFWGIALPDTGGDFKVRPALGRNGVVKETNADRSEGGEVYIKLKYIKAT